MKLSKVNQGRAGALFLSLQLPIGSEPDEATAAAAIAKTTAFHREHGGCDAAVAYAIGDAPHWSAPRMKWAKKQVARLYPEPAPEV